MDVYANWKNKSVKEELIAFIVDVNAGKSINCKFTAKSDFGCRVSYVTIADADIGSLKSLHTLFDKYLDHMLVKFEQNRMVGTIQNFVLFGKK